MRHNTDMSFINKSMIILRNYIPWHPMILSCISEGTKIGDCKVPKPVASPPERAAFVSPSNGSMKSTSLTCLVGLVGAEKN